MVDAGVDGATDGAPPDLAGSGGGGPVATGGTGGGGTGGPSTGGRSTGGGGAGVGGVPGAGTGGGSAGAPVASGGAGGGGAGGVSDASVPSPGCALAIAQPAERAEDPTTHLFITRKVPSTYDGVASKPMIFALHATGFNDVTMLSDLMKDQPMADRYVMVAPRENTSAVSGYTSFEERPVQDFSQMLTNILNELCIDQRRIFVVGNGSGGRALTKWITYTASPNATSVIPAFRGFAMVGTIIGSGNRGGPLPTIFIHPLESHNSAGIANDSDGTKALSYFRTRNSCGESSVPVTAAGCVAGGMPVNPGCVDFDGCAQPLRFCHHDDLTNQSSGDPWSCMASPAIFQFFASYL